MNLNLDSPLLISLLIYIPLCLYLYYYKPSFLVVEDDENKITNKNNKRIDMFKRNKNIIFILLPFILYGTSSVFISNRTKRNYCKYLTKKDLKIKDLLEKCKNN